jgi:XTP/dITP diphosphohydrolase
MAKDLLIGSGNKDKARELMKLLESTSWTVKSLADFEPIEEPEETESTFVGNALLKARYYSEQFGLPCVADDSGLEVNELDGAPGVYSARYAGENCTYQDNNLKLLDALENTSIDRRGARFVCVAAFVDGNAQEHTEEGTVDGVIAIECRGEKGFGYDPLFIPSGFDETFAEMTPEEKHIVSHRGKAFQKMGRFLEQFSNAELC